MVTVQYYKYPRTLHWRHQLVRLGEDDHGVWLGGPAGTVEQRGMEEPMPIGHPFVQLVPEGTWWSAFFFHAGRAEIYVDVVTSAIWPSPERVEMIDLDLDVIRLRDGTVFVDDEDEFEEHRVSLGYPPKMADTARSTAARLVLDLEAERPPFDRSWERWLVEVV